MTIFRRRRWRAVAQRLALAVAILLPVGRGTLVSSSAWAQAPRTIKLVVPFPPGGSADILARVLAEQISRTQPTNVVIENRPGADTIVATEAVARAAPDGGTLLITANPYVTNPQLGKSNYDPLTSFEFARSRAHQVAQGKSRAAQALRGRLRPTPGYTGWLQKSESNASSFDAPMRRLDPAPMRADALEWVLLPLD
jgi:hypothetical protein